LQLRAFFFLGFWGFSDACTKNFILKKIKDMKTCKPMHALPRAALSARRIRREIRDVDDLDRRAGRPRRHGDPLPANLCLPTRQFRLISCDKKNKIKKSQLSVYWSRPNPSVKPR
jgi:hypothetical protein